MTTKNTANAKSITPISLAIIKRKEQDLLSDYQNFVLEKNPNEFYLSIKGGKLESVRKLMNFPIFSPKDQTEKVKMGNAVEIVINGETKVLFLDGVSVQRINLGPKYMIISTDSEIGKALINKKPGKSGSYFSKDNRKCFFKIKKIISYSEAKKIFLKAN